MTDILGVSPLLFGSFLSLCFMYTIKTTRLRDSQGKFVGLMIVILAIGILVIVSGYRGLLANPFSSDVVSMEQASAQMTHTEPVDRKLQVNSGISKNPKSEHVYGIMFDAGSTGSRIHVFKFKHAAPGDPFEFVEELFLTTKPGLSVYADTPNQAAESLREMLNNATKYVPTDQWKSTPIALKATAGLRKLQEAEADNILNEVQKLFVDSPFQHGNDSVVIMEGTDEGVFSWFTVNYYAGVLGKIDQMQGVMDLGGGSTQITFNPIQKDTINNADPSFLLKKNILGEDVTLYTYSYLDLGLMAARVQMLGGEVGFEVEDGAPIPTLSSPCLPENFKGKFKFGQTEYSIQGVPPSVSRLEDCYRAAKGVIEKYKIATSNEIQHKQFCAISYYHDKAVESGLLPDDDKGGIVHVKDYYSTATQVCKSPKVENEFLCLDLCYISALLQEGFHMAPDNSLSVQKKINGQEISWALGAMFDFYSSHKMR